MQPEGAQEMWLHQVEEPDLACTPAFVVAMIGDRQDRDLVLGVVLSGPHLAFDDQPGAVMAQPARQDEFVVVGCLLQLTVADCGLIVESAADRIAIAALDIWAGPRELVAIGPDVAAVEIPRDTDTGRRAAAVM